MSEQSPPAVFTRLEEVCRAHKPRLIFPEGNDPRVRAAAERAAAAGLAQPILLESDLGQAATGVSHFSPEVSPHFQAYSEAFHQLRKHKGVDLPGAAEAMRNPLVFAAMAVRQGDADGTIGGAVNATADIVRAALQVIGTAPDQSMVSSFFLMQLPPPQNRAVIFADCGLVVEPSPSELAEIAIASARSLRLLTGEEPRIAFLSFSTLGSAQHVRINATREALSLAKARAPEIAMDGELQFDAAMVSEIAERKASGSPVAGHANVFVFPNLEAGNIGYKIAERIGGAIAIGPTLQGLARPANDLSRGCSAEDIYKMIAVTGAQAAADQATV
ncbi:MAG: phosphate acetyltransferase [Pseudomonadota bacterium]